jgi:hypothetical protein
MHWTRQKNSMSEVRASHLEAHMADQAVPVAVGHNFHSITMRECHASYLLWEFHYVIPCCACGILISICPLNKPPGAANFISGNQALLDESIDGVHVNFQKRCHFGWREYFPHSALSLLGD